MYVTLGRHYTHQRNACPEKPYPDGGQVPADQNSHKNKRSPGDTKHCGKLKKGEIINEMVKKDSV